MKTSIRYLLVAIAFFGYLTATSCDRNISGKEDFRETTDGPAVKPRSVEAHRSALPSTPGDVGPSETVILEIVDKKLGLFRIVNKTGLDIELSSLFPQGMEEFAASNVHYAVLRKGKWLYMNGVANAIPYGYSLAPNESLKFRLGIEKFEILGVSHGETVKMVVDNFHSTPFVW